MTQLFVCAGGEVGTGSTIHDNITDAMATGDEYIDIFDRGEGYPWKHSVTLKLVDGKYTSDF
jgi:hypothetical protein